jgi:hypothetical protein
MILRTSDKFNSIYDDLNVGVVEPFRPSLRAICQDNTFAELPANWRGFKVVDTDTQAPSFVSFPDLINVDMDEWKKGNPINEKDIEVIDNDRAEATGPVTFTQKRKDGGKPENILIIESDKAQPWEHPWKTLVKLQLVDDVENGNYSITLGAKDVKGNTEEVEIWINVHNGGNQITGAFVLATLGALIASWIRH